MKMNALMMVVGFSGLVGCGTVADVTGRQVDAVNAVVNATCDRYEACGQIGSGKKYTTKDECHNQEVSNWDGRWPSADCDKRINGDNLDICLNAVKGTDCNNIIDQINTAYNKCAKSDVCKGE